MLAPHREGIIRVDLQRFPGQGQGRTLITPTREIYVAVKKLTGQTVAVKKLPLKAVTKQVKIRRLEGSGSSAEGFVALLTPLCRSAKQINARWPRCKTFVTILSSIYWK